MTAMVEHHGASLAVPLRNVASVFSDVVAALTAVGALATAAAVFVAIWQLRIAQAHARMAFEDDLSREYRSILAELPAHVFCTSNGEFALDHETMGAFYRYFDLSNEQLFLARQGRISPETVEQWQDGIRGNIQELPAFRAAWAEIGERVPNDFFEDLRVPTPPA